MRAEEPVMRKSASVVVAVIVVACSRTETPPEAVPSPAASAQSPVTEPAYAQGASGAAHHVELMSAQGGQVGGTFDLVASAAGVAITGQVTGLKPDSVHGFHIHEKGDCSSADFKSAGDHFDPASQPHGDPATPPHHLGDLPNVVANAEGKADVNAWVEGATLGDSGPNDLVGKAIIVHEKMDDYTTQPSGNAGDRMACGVIR